MINIKSIDLSIDSSDDFCFRSAASLKYIFIKVEWNNCQKEIIVKYDPPVEDWILNKICYGDLIKYIHKTYDKFINIAISCDGHTGGSSIGLKDIENELVIKINKLIYARIVLASKALNL